MHDLSFVRIAVRRALRAKAFRVADCRVAALLLPLAGLGCSMSDDRMAMAYVDPATYSYHSCEQLEAAAKGAVANQRLFEERINKAERGTGGTVVSMVAYRADYLAAVGSLRLIEQAQKDKNCPPPPPEHKVNLR